MDRLARCAQGASPVSSTAPLSVQSTSLRFSFRWDRTVPPPRRPTPRRLLLAPPDCTLPSRAARPQVAHKGLGAPKGPVALAAAIVRREGVLGLFRGFWATVVRDSPSTGVYYLAYEAAREAADPGTRLVREGAGRLLPGVAVLSLSVAVRRPVCRGPGARTGGRRSSPEASRCAKESGAGEIAQPCGSSPLS